MSTSDEMIKNQVDPNMERWKLLTCTCYSITSTMLHKYNPRKFPQSRLNLIFELFCGDRGVLVAKLESLLLSMTCKMHRSVLNVCVEGNASSGLQATSVFISSSSASPNGS